MNIQGHIPPIEGSKHVLVSEPPSSRCVAQTMSMGWCVVDVAFCPSTHSTHRLSQLRRAHQGCVNTTGRVAATINPCWAAAFALEIQKPLQTQDNSLTTSEILAALGHVARRGSMPSINPGRRKIAAIKRRRLNANASFLQTYQH